MIEQQITSFNPINARIRIIIVLILVITPLISACKKDNEMDSETMQIRSIAWNSLDSGQQSTVVISWKKASITDSTYENQSAYAVNFSTSSHNELRPITVYVSKELLTVLGQSAILKIGLIADPQYADKTTANNRYYRESLQKVRDAIATFNEQKVDFVQNLGDIIDGDWKSFDSITSVYQSLDPSISVHYLLGNHDFAIDSIYMDKLTKRLSMPSLYYSYTKMGIRFVSLDSNDYSYYANDLHHYNISSINYYYDKIITKRNYHTYNSAIGDEQQKWLRDELESAQKVGQKVIIFSHAPIKPLSFKYNLWNDAEVANIIEQYPNVIAFINGHDHNGNYVFDNNIHYITLSGMVQTTENAYGILEIYKNRIILKGYGKQQNIPSNEAT